ncbi:class F sortase, partial [Streptomyces phaeofaciens]
EAAELATQVQQHLEESERIGGVLSALAAGPKPPEEETNLVGWYATGPAPGERGTAVAVGHLDTDTDRAVFWGLSQLAPNHPVEVRRADGRIAVYTVDRLRTYEKAHFPNQEVYGDRGRAELRLITCGGAFDRRTGYAGNLVVFAHLVTVKEPDRPAPPA